MVITPRMPSVQEPTSPEDILPALRTVVSRVPQRTFNEGLGLKPGERVLIVTDSTISPILTEGFQEAIRDAGGHVDVVSLEGYPLLDDPLALVDGPNTTNWYPEWLWNAANQADVLLCLAFFKFPHTPNLPWGRRAERPKIKARPVQWELPPDMLLNSSLMYPLELWDEIDEKTHALMAGARRIEIVDAGGTRLNFDLTEEDWVGAGRRDSEEEGPASDRDYTPGHLFVPFPKSRKLEGEITIDSLTFGGPVEPTKLVVANRKVTEIRGGGTFGERLRQSFDEYKDLSFKGMPGPGADWISTFAMCTNPKYRRSPNWEQMRGSARVHSWCLGHRRSGVLHASIGAVQVGENHKVIRHFDMMFPTVVADGRPVIQEGHLVALDDPHVRAVAEKFGNPDDLLREDWIPDPKKGI